MKNAKGFLCAVLALLLTLSLAACGGKGDSVGGMSGVDSAEDDPGKDEGEAGDKGDAAEVPGGDYRDTWENAMGGTGYVEYEYEDVNIGDLKDVDPSRSYYTDAPETDTGTVRKVSRMTLKYENGLVWQIVEYTYNYLSAVDLSDETRVLNANGDLIYRTVTYCRTTDSDGQPVGEIYKNFAQTFNAKGKQIATRNYTASDWMQIENANWDGVYDFSKNFAVFCYDGSGRKSGIREYDMDGMLCALWDYKYGEDGKLEQLDRLHFFDNYTKYALPEFDSQGRVVALNDKYASKDEDPLFTFTYDDAGRLVQRTGYVAGLLDRYLQVFTYREDGSLAECMTLDKPGDLEKIESGDILYRPSFQYDEQGRLTVEDHGYLIAGQRTSCWVYEYYDSGLISHVSEYKMGGYGDGESPISETRYDETGAVIDG